jgi:hypothetical protein
VKLWKTLLLVVAAGLLVWYAVANKDEEPIDREAGRSVVQLCGFKSADDITEIAVTAADGAFTVERTLKPGVKPNAKPKKGESKYLWKITAPFQSDADPVTVDAWVRTLLSAKATQSYTKEQTKDISDSDTGLDQPKTQLVLKGVNGRSGTLLLGGKTPKDDAYYGRVKDKTALLIFAQYYVDENLAAKKLNDLRDKTLLKMAANEVQGLTLTFPDETIKLTKDKDKWQMETGGKTLPADASTIEEMVATLASTKIDKFVETAPKDLTTYGLDKPRITVTVDMGANGGEVGLLLGSATADTPKPTSPNQRPQPSDEKVYLQRKGETEVMQASNSLYTALLQTPDDLRDKLVLAVNVPNTTKIAYTLKDQQVLLEKAATPGSKDLTPVWQLRQPAAMPADSKKVERILNELKSLLVTKQGFLDQPGDLAQYGLAKPQATIDLSEGDTALPQLALGKAADDNSGVFVKRADSKIVMKVAAGSRLLSVLEVAPNRLRDLSVLKLDRTKVNAITIKGKDREGVLLNAKGATEWQVKSDKPKAAKSKDKDKDKSTDESADDNEPKKADQGKIAGLLTALEDLRGDEWVADKADDLATYGLKEPDTTVIVTMADGAKHTLLLGRDPQPSSMVVFFKLDGKDPIYRSDDGMVLTPFQCSARDFAPVPQPQPGMPMGMGGMGGPPPGEEDMPPPPEAEAPPPE